jgi:hypothetical protein
MRDEFMRWRTSVDDENKLNEVNKFSKKGKGRPDSKNTCGF